MSIQTRGPFAWGGGSTTHCGVCAKAGDAAMATCHGSARYVPKVGSREPRVEPRVWNFTLRKLGSDWTIETARADR